MGLDGDLDELRDPLAIGDIRFAAARAQAGLCGRVVTFVLRPETRPCATAMPRLALVLAARTSAPRLVLLLTPGAEHSPRQDRTGRAQRLYFLLQRRFVLLQLPVLLLLLDECATQASDGDAQRRDRRRACECPHRHRGATSPAGLSPLAEPARLSLSDKPSSALHGLHSASHGTAPKAPCSCPPDCGLQSLPGEAPRSAPAPRRLARVPARSTFSGHLRPKRSMPTAAQPPTDVRRCWRSAGSRAGNPRRNASCAGP